MKILVLNCGSSSVKYQLLEMEDDREQVLAGGVVDEVGLGQPSIAHRRSGFEKVIRTEVPARDHQEAIRLVLEILLDPHSGSLQSVEELDAVGHRVVHGGERFAVSDLISEEVLRALYENVPLAPLHNPPNIQGIEAVQALVPEVPQVAVFDTAFHQSMDAPAYLYAIPYRFYERYRIRRYGFHGTSHRYVAQRAAAFLGQPLEKLKIVTCHLGNGASVTAVCYGKSVITSMGFTPLEGLAMGTRCGDLDPAIVPFLIEREGLDATEAQRLLNEESGVLGLSELSSDMRVFERAIHSGPEHPDYERSLLVLQLYTGRVKRYIGSYAAAMSGLDCVVYTGGVGENFPEICDWSCQGLEFLGIHGVRAQRAGGRVIEVSAAGSRVKVLVVPTNEELAIARDTYAIVSAQSVDA
jgi:acetate kinase